MDSFFINAQWRSGSTLVAYSLHQYLNSLGKDNSSVEHCRNDMIEDYKNYCVYHSHNPNNLRYVPKNFTIIYTYRDLFESTISTLIGNYFLHENTWHRFFSTPLQFIRDNPIYIDFNDYNRAILGLIEFHRTTERIIKELDIECYNINYNEIKDNPNNVFQKLKIDYTISQNFIKEHLPLPVHKSLNYQEMIVNYNEIKEYIMSLPLKPTAI